MPTVSNAARVTTRDGAVWRTCPVCDLLKPVAPAALLCDDCASPTTKATAGTWSR